MNSSKDFNVTTVSGKQLPRNKCRYIQKEYYEINIDCFLMEDDRWHRINNGKIAYDYEKGKHVIIENSYLREGIIGIKENGEFSYGLFSPNPIKNTEINNIPCISFEIAESLGLKERISTGTFYSEDKTSSIEDFNKKGIASKYSFPLDYSAGPRIKMFTEAYNELYQKKTTKKINPDFIKELGATTFGFEIETHNGSIPERKLVANGLIPLRDGSLKHDNLEPYEYTTIPLSGEKGLYSMIDIMDLIQRYTEIGDKCSLHVHLGGFKPSKEFVVALHRVALKIQDEIYSMFPSGYKYTSENGFKQKDYCAPINNLRILKGNSVSDNFDVIFSHYSGGHDRFVDFGYCNHPKDDGNRAKWNVNERYKICNIIPLIWGKSGTVEWRCHVPTQSSDKAINWLFITNAIVAYCHKHAKTIAEFSPLTKLNLEDILKDVYSVKLAKILCGYVNWRIDYMKSMDSTGRKELLEDLTKEIPYSLLS